MNFNNKSPHGLNRKTLIRFPKVVIEEGNEEVNIYWMTEEDTKTQKQPSTNSWFISILKCIVGVN
jgi:hypothetical protein